MTKQASLKRVVEQAAADVKKWPAWMRNGDDSEKTAKNESTGTQAAKPGKK